MAGLNILFLSSLFLAYLLCPSTYAAFITHRCSIGTLDDPVFQTALGDTFSHLASSSSTSKSNNSTSKGGGGGGGGGEIHASFHCWRRTSSQMACKKYVNSATKSILRLCAGQQNGTVWNTGCTLHYYTSTHKLNNNQENVPWVYWYSLSNIDQITNKAQFHESLTEFMSGLIDKATDSTLLHASGEEMVTLLDTLYATVECSRGESPSTCKACLRAAVERVSGCCGGSTAAEVILPSCRLGYDVGPSTSRASLVGPFSSASFSRVALKSVATS